MNPAAGVEGLWDVTVLRMTLGPLVPRYMDYGHIFGQSPNSDSGEHKSSAAWRPVRRI